MNPSQSDRVPPFRKSILKRILFPVAAIILGAVASLILGEIILRVFRIQPARYPAPQWSAWDGTAFRQCDVWGQDLIHRTSPFVNAGVVMGEHVPGARFKVTYASNPRGYFDSGNSVLFTINSIGLRGEEIRAEKPPGAYRILGLGDSFTLGYGVKDSDTFLRHLEARLNTNTPAPKRYEVLNAAVGGYNTRDEVVYLERRWLALKPDLVLIVFYINDAYDDSAILNMGQGLGIRDGKPAGMAQYSYLWDLAQHAWRAHQESKALEAYYKQLYFADARNFLKNPGEFKMDWTVSRAALERAAQITRERNIKLGLVMFPELHKLDGSYPFLQIHELVRESCQQSGIPFLDLLDTFRGRDPKSLWVHPSDHHPNEAAHAMAGEAIEKFVRKEFVRDGAP